MRRFSAGIRAILAVLCTALIVADEHSVSRVALAVLLAYDLWAAAVLWGEASGRTPRRPLLHYWIDATWAVAVLQLTTSAAAMMVIALVQPVVLASIGHGVRQGVALAMYGAAGMLLQIVPSGGALLRQDQLSWVCALCVFAVVPMAAVLSRPMSILRQRLQLVRQIEDQLDPRRGLESMGSTLVQALRQGTGVDVMALVLPAASANPALVSTDRDGTFRISAEMQARLEALVDRLPRCPTTYVAPSWFGLRGGVRIHGACAADAGQAPALAALAELLEARMVVVVPLMRYERRHGSLIVGLRDPRMRFQEVAALADAAPDLFRLIEQAALVDRLQEESAAHERVRIGRDLHDSAIQPYIGLKYAVEGVACRVACDNPVYDDIRALQELVESECGALREIISGLRVGEGRGDNAFVPAVRRQVQRFKLLFGIDVELEAPASIAMSRALAGAMFHMVNEAMNNVRKHSAADHVRIVIEPREDSIELRVRDNAASRQGTAQPDFEPRSLRERVAELGGTLRLHRPDGRDTELLISIPLQPNDRVGVQA
jgi:signal transduction histidine kinase